MTHCRRRATIGAALLLVLAACADRSPAEPAVEGLTVREVILVADDGTVAFSHRDHWHGAPAVREGGAVGIALHFTDWQASGDEHDAPPVERWFTLADKPAEYDVRVVVEDETVGRWTGDRVRGSLAGLAPGASRLSIIVRRNGATLYEAPPLNFRVLAP